MIRYLDSSALVKRYVPESGSDELRVIFADPENLVTSRLTWVEVFSALARRLRERSMTPPQHASGNTSLSADFIGFGVIEISREVAERAAQLCETHGLRSGDSIHLSSALLIRGEGAREVVFITADRSLARISEREGLRPLVPGE